MLCCGPSVLQELLSGILFEKNCNDESCNLRDFRIFADSRNGRVKGRKLMIMTLEDDEPVRSAVWQAENSTHCISCVEADEPAKNRPNL